MVGLAAVVPEDQEVLEADLVDQEVGQEEDHEEGSSGSGVGSALVSKVNKSITRT